MTNLYVVFFPGIETGEIINDIVIKYKDKYDDIIFTDEVENYISGDLIVVYCDFRISLISNISDDVNEETVEVEINKSFNDIKKFINLIDNENVVENFVVKESNNYHNLDYDYKQLINKLLEKDLLKYGFVKLNHCIGDSHAAFFSGSGGMPDQWPGRSNDILPFFKSYRIGPCTAYNLHSKKYILDDIISKMANKEKDRIIFCFGEVDCRVHVKRFMEHYGKSMEEVVDDIVYRYMGVVKFYKDSGFDVGVWGPIASFPEEHTDQVHIDFMVNYEKVKDLGTCHLRNTISKYFNEKVKEYCENNDIHFITIFYDMVDDNLITNEKYVDESIHLSLASIPLAIDQFEKNELI